MLTDGCQAELAGNTILHPSPKPGSLDNQPSTGKVQMWRLFFLSRNYYRAWSVPVRLRGW